MFTRVLGAALLGMFLLASSAQAHPDFDLTDQDAIGVTIETSARSFAAAITLPNSSVDPTPLLLVATAILLATCLGLRRPRRAAALTLALLLALFAVETSLHGVHHLGDAARAANCTLANASAHCSGIAPAVVDAAPVLVTIADRVAQAEPGALPTAVRTSQHDRAPPLPA